MTRSADPADGDPRHPTEVVYLPDGPMLKLHLAQVRVVLGPDQGASFPMELRRVRIGSATNNDLTISDPLVSRHHLEFQVQDNGYLVQDQQSTNGTFYRGARIKEALVGVSAEIRVGDTVLRIEPGDQRSQSVPRLSTFGNIVGTSPAMQEIYGLLATVAPSDVTVLIQGETGTGKELIAEEIHRCSPRRMHPLCVVDCGAIPENLIESELFGHERGAFTGAVSAREGVFEKAQGGVVFLDEIGELPLQLQTRLLRVLERRVIKRVGSNLERNVDFRVIAATNKDLRHEVDEGRFREDLYFRLVVVRISNPPLRDRIEDIPLLARHFLWQSGCPNPDEVLTPEVLEVLTTRQWPGNVRELRNAVERAVLFTDGVQDPFDSVKRMIELRDSPPEEEQPAAGAQEQPREPGEPWDEHWLDRALPHGFLEKPYKVAKELLNSQFEIAYIKRLLQLHGRNISRIAVDAGIDRHMVRKLMRKHGFDT